jgi:hypothetical protein
VRTPTFIAFFSQSRKKLSEKEKALEKAPGKTWNSGARKKEKKKLEFTLSGF